MNYSALFASLLRGVTFYGDRKHRQNFFSILIRLISLGKYASIFKDGSGNRSDFIELS